MGLDVPLWVWLLAVRAVSAVGDPEITAGLMVALMWVESLFKVDALGLAGEIGLTQLMPGTAALLGVVDPWDPQQNVIGGATYLSRIAGQFGDVPTALSAYNSGPGCVCSPGYAARVLGVEFAPSVYPTEIWRLMR